MSQICCAEKKERAGGGGKAKVVVVAVLGGGGESQQAQDEARLKSAVNPHTSKQAYVLLSKSCFVVLLH